MNRNNYDDIIDLPRHVSKVHPQMSISDRAAQFAPFSALTGYKDAIIEVDRYTQEFIELDDSEKEVIGQKLYILNEHKKENTDDHNDQQETGSTTLMKPRILFNIFRCQIFTVFQTVNRLMFCTMIHEHPLYIFHFRYEPYIYKK